MKNLPFLQELVEARLYKGANTLQGKTAKEIAHIVFLMLLSLEIMRNEDKTHAIKYARATMQFGDFDTMRSASTDLANLLAVLENQEDYEDRIQTDPSISVPFLQLKRYLIDLQSGRPTSSIDQSFLLKLEDFLKVTDSVLKTLRRYVTHWDNQSDGEKHNAIEIIKREFNTRSNYNDLYLHLKQERFSF